MSKYNSTDPEDSPDSALDMLRDAFQHSSRHSAPGTAKMGTPFYKGRHRRPWWQSRSW